MQRICPNCGHIQRPTMRDAAPHRVEHAKRIASEYGIEIWPGNFVRETDAAALLGMTASALRKQVMEGRNEVDFIQRGNRRFYSLEQIAEFL